MSVSIQVSLIGDSNNSYIQGGTIVFSRTNDKGEIGIRLTNPDRTITISGEDFAAVASVLCRQ